MTHLIKAQVNIRLIIKPIQANGKGYLVIKKKNMTMYPEMNEQEKKLMWEEIAMQLAKPKSQRPQHKEMYDMFGIPESTYYWTTSKREFKQKIVENCLNEAKEWMPELLEVLKDKALVDKSEKSIEMALKYIAEVSEKIDHTSKGEKIGLDLTQEQRKRLAEYELRAISGTSEQGKTDTVLPSTGQELPSELAS